MVKKETKKVVKASEEKVDEKIVEKKVVKKKKKEEPMKISDLPGVGPAAVEKLESAGIFDLMGVAVLGPKEMGEMAGLSESVARKTIQAARKMMDLGFQAYIAKWGYEYYNNPECSNMNLKLLNRFDDLFKI